MFGSMKKAMVAAAIVAVGAMTPAMASAEQWSVGGAPYAGPAHIEGRLAMTMSNGWKNTCDVALQADLDNGAAGGVAQGQVQTVLLGVPVAGSACTTNVAGCSLSFMAAPSPLPIATSGRNVTVSGISYGVTYSGAGCGLNGVTIGVFGSTTGSMASGAHQIVYTNSPGLTTTLTPATVSGTLDAFAAKPTGGPDLTKPITLQP